MSRAATTISSNRASIRLTEERWRHITKHHPELRPFKTKILRAVSEPHAIYASPPGYPQSLAAVRREPALRRKKLPENLVVHYRETRHSAGFILTAFPMSDKRLMRRFQKWLRVK